MDLLFNGVSLVSVATAILTLVVICVPKLRKKFTEYIILEYNEDKQLEEIKQLKQQIADLQEQSKQQQALILEMSNQLAGCKALLLQQATDQSLTTHPLTTDYPTTEPITDQ